MSYPYLDPHLSENTPLVRGRLIPRPEGVFDESSRQPTDRFWLIPFFVAVIAFIAVTVVAGCSGEFKGLANNRKNLTNGPTCGFDSNVLDNPYVLYVDERDCTKRNVSIVQCTAPWICVKKCPSGLFNVDSCTSANFPTLKENIACQSKAAQDSVINCDTLTKAVQLKQCAAWFNGTEEFLGFCHSRGVQEQPSENDFMEFNDIGELLKKIVPSFLFAILIAVVVSFFFIITLKWSAAFVFWGFVFIVMGLLAVGIIAAGVGLGQVVKHAKTEQEASDAKTMLYVMVGVMSVVFLVFVLCLYLFRHKIRCGIEIVKESSRAVTCSYSSVCFPLLPFIIRAVVGLSLIFGVIMAMVIRTNYYSVHGSLVSSDCVCTNTPAYKFGDTCLPEKFNKDCHSSTGGVCDVATCQLDDQVGSDKSGIYIGILIFTGMWIVAFVQANTKMVLAHVFGNWYWNWNQEFIPSGAVCTAMGKILGNHTGTAAFGSLIITLCRILKNLLNSREREGGEGGIGAIIMRIIGECIRACAQALLTIIEFVSDKAFVVCAIMGTTFWDSVKGVSQIMVKDIPLVLATEYVGDIILFVCKFVAAIASAGLFYAIAPFSNDNEQAFKIIFAIIIFVFAYDLASILLTAYDVAIDTLLVCGLQDYMHNKAEKAYFQSETLNELLLQKNTA